MSCNGSEFNVLEKRFMLLKRFKDLKKILKRFKKIFTWSILSIGLVFMKGLSNTGGNKSSGSNVSVTSTRSDESILTLSSHLSPLS